jgi:hypothetical protein
MRYIRVGNDGSNELTFKFFLFLLRCHVLTISSRESVYVVFVAWSRLGGSVVIVMVMDFSRQHQLRIGVYDVKSICAAEDRRDPHQAFLGVLLY